MLHLNKTPGLQLPTDTLKLNVSDAAPRNSPKLYCVGATSAVKTKTFILSVWKKNIPNGRIVEDNLMQMKIWFREGCFHSLLEVNGFLIRGHGHQPIISIKISLNELVHIWTYHVHLLWQLVWFCRCQFCRHEPIFSTFHGFIVAEPQEPSEFFFVVVLYQVTIEHLLNIRSKCKQLFPKEDQNLEQAIIKIWAYNHYTGA